MSETTRTRLCALGVVAIVIPIGLFARAHRASADPSNLTGFLATYTGDTLWPVMFYFMGRFCFPAMRILPIVIGVLTLTLTLEFGQLWQPPWLQHLRSLPVIGFLLGNSFIWSDVWCCLLGTMIATGVDMPVRYLVSQPTE